MLSPARAILDDLANLFTLAGFALAFWAVANPGTVSVFLEDIARFSEDSSDSLQGIDVSSADTARNTADTARNTAELAAQIPSTLRFSAETVQGAGRAPLLFVFLENPAASVYEIQKITVEFQLDEANGFESVPVDLSRYSGALIPPGESFVPISSRFPIRERRPQEMWASICFEASPKNADRAVVEKRTLVLIHEGEVRQPWLIAYDLALEAEAEPC